MNSTPSPHVTLFQRLLARRHGGTLLFFIVYLGIALLTRGALLVKAAHDVTWTLSLLAAFFWGFIYDLGAAAYASLALTLVLTLLPTSWFQRRWQQWIAHAGGFLIIYALLFGLVAEWTFWDEFGVRFNFIAVDYLVYTHEVVGNIRESYNLPLIFSGVFLGALLIHWVVARTGWPARWFAAPAEPLGRRLKGGALWLGLPLVFATLLTGEHMPDFRNNYNRELGKDGLWALFAAFWNNELAYENFYPTVPMTEAFGTVRAALARDTSVRLGADPVDTLHVVRNDGPALRPNVIQVTVESLSGEFLGSLNPASKLTPNLDELAGKSLVFDNFYATGTRTDRGMEALTLAVPPTPGRSLVKRPRNENMFTLGSVFRAQGYDTAFLYGGFGYFDNMNYFFGHNGYRVVDRNAVKKDDITFANVWGACDEDLFRWTLREADASVAAGKPFHFFVMTTSNHRPYTYPEGRIDLPPKISGRAGAVKYTDYAIGKLIRDASAKPWFKDTVFVIVADHCASSAGRTELPVQNYHIPLIIYAPGGQIAPGHIRTLTSQVDFAPTLLGLLHWSYASRFFGRDINRIAPADGNAFVGTYQKLGMLRGDDFAVLSPVRKQAQYRYDRQSYALAPQPLDPAFQAEAISYYEAASRMFEEQRYRELTADEAAKLMTAAAKP
ncbi:MAG TPA: LTA synthase family protein [Lacunisphaera sp.]|nr:LTA synthase family protein [Lacunisphaera sp.]